MRHTTVSVVIPTHNRLLTLQRAIDSVLDQSFAVDEIIVIDDGSSDGTANWLQNQPEPVHAIIQHNCGVSHARNRGIEAASGEWIALLDSDDYWHRDKLEKQLTCLSLNRQCRLCHCDEIWIRNGKRINQKNKHRKSGGHIFEQCLPLCVISPSAALIQRSVFANYGGFDESLPACEDYDMWLRISSKEPVAFIDEPLLTKTGGHDDQLSSRYPLMDSFRLQALAGLLRSGSLDADQFYLTRKTFLTKLEIISKGARKRQNDLLVEKLSEQYADIIEPRNSKDQSI